MPRNRSAINTLKRPVSWHSLEEHLTFQIAREFYPPQYSPSAMITAVQLLFFIYVGKMHRLFEHVTYMLSANLMHQNTQKLQYTHVQNTSS